MINNNHLTSYIVFSKNRACQLEFNIRMAFKYWKNLKNIYVLYTYSNDEYKAGYEKLKKEHPYATFILENNFKNDFINIVEYMIKGDYYFGMADDDCFIADVDTNNISNVMKNIPNIFSYSLRFNECTDINSVTNELMNIPKFLINNNEMLMWDWTKCNRKHDWGYPFAFTCTAIRKSDMLSIMKSIPFKNSGQLEGKCNHKRNYNKPYMASSNDTKIVTLSINEIIGTNINNPHGNITSEYLNRKYLYEDERISRETITTFDWTRTYMTSKINLKFSKMVYLQNNKDN